MVCVAIWMNKNYCGPKCPPWVRVSISGLQTKWSDHHQNPTSVPFPVRDFEGVGGGVTAFQTTVIDGNNDGNAEERFVMTNRIARVSRLFRSRKAASLRLGLRKSRKVRLLVVIAGAQRSTSIAVAGNQT